MNYYYLMASLPMLTLGTPPAVSLQDFVNRCSEQLAGADLAVLLDLLKTGGRASRHPFAATWARRDGTLRNAVVRLRASRLGREAGTYLRTEAGEDPDTARLAAGAYARTNPLDREMELDRIRWRILEELAGFNRFSLPAVLAYGLQLKLAERWAALSAERGRRAVEEYVNR